MKTATFYYQGDRTTKVTVNSAGTVVETTSEDYPVGMPKAVKQLRACGWAPIRKPVVFDVFGSRIYS